MGNAGGFVMVYIFVVILIIAIFVAISRWVFRINDIVERLDKIVHLLEGVPEKPKSFIDGIKKGMAE